MLGCPVGVDVVLANIVHRKLLNSGGDRFGTERPDTQRRHVKVSHFTGACGVCHYRFEEGGSRLEERYFVSFDN